MLTRKYLACTCCGKKDGRLCREGRGCPESRPKGPVTAQLPDGKSGKGLAEGGFRIGVPDRFYGGG